MEAAAGPNAAAEPTSDVREGLARLTTAFAEGAAGSLLAHHGIDLVVLFGSARDDTPSPRAARPPGDLDLAVGHAGGLDVLALMADLYRITGLEAVDVVDLDRAGVVTRGEVFSTGRPLYQAVRGVFAERVAEALPMLWDTAWLRRLQLESLAGRAPS